MSAPAREPGLVPSARQTPAADAAGRLGFPDAPRLELDQLLAQLRDRADDVLATQGRLRGLLRANALVAGELSLPLVLRPVVESARGLVGRAPRAAPCAARGHLRVSGPSAGRTSWSGGSATCLRAGGSWAC